MTRSPSFSRSSWSTRMNIRPLRASSMISSIEEIASTNSDLGRLGIGVRVSRACVGGRYRSRRRKARRLSRRRGRSSARPGGSRPRRAAAHQSRSPGASPISMTPPGAAGRRALPAPRPGARAQGAAKGGAGAAPAKRDAGLGLERRRAARAASSGAVGEERAGAVPDRAQPPGAVVGQGVARAQDARARSRSRGRR